MLGVMMASDMLMMICVVSGLGLAVIAMNVQDRLFHIQQDKLDQEWMAQRRAKIAAEEAMLAAAEEAEIAKLFLPK